MGTEDYGRSLKELRELMAKKIKGVSWSHSLKFLAYWRYSRRLVAEYLTLNFVIRS